MFVVPPDSRFGQADFVMPCSVCLVVVEEDGGTEPVGVQGHPVGPGQELPSPLNGLGLEIISEREVSQHLEKGVVVGGYTDVADVAGSQAHLAGRGPGEVQWTDAQELVLELVHSCRREQHGRVVGGDQHIGRAAGVTLGLEEREVPLADFVGIHRGRIG